jgi:thiamine-monophosphate kinase
VSAPLAQPRALREDDVVAAIHEIVASATSRRIVLGIGDDAAIWQPSRSHRSVITTDMLVEGVHFTRELMPFFDMGWRAMAANVSDVAAMGARPVLATIAVGVPETVSPDELFELYRGLAAMAARAKISVVGGDLSRAPVLTLAIAAVGEVRPSNVKVRSGGRPGDVVAVTGPLGAARAGLLVARDALTVDDDVARTALDAFRRPQPRVAEGRFLAASRNVRAMMDCSDGLSTDLDRLCTASGCGAVVECVPVADGARAIAEQIGEDPQSFALAGGEDFELIVAIRAQAYPHLSLRFAAHFGRPLLRVGRLRPQAGVSWREDALARSGWDHFAR